eukprot:COSAG06_NODE_2875_length_6146_cov_8.191335_3_plen_62_part_00
MWYKSSHSKGFTIAREVRVAQNNLLPCFLQRYRFYRDKVGPQCEATIGENRADFFASIGDD